MAALMRTSGKKERKSFRFLALIALLLTGNAYAFQPQDDDARDMLMPVFPSVSGKQEWSVGYSREYFSDRQEINISGGEHQVHDPSGSIGAIDIAVTSWNKNINADFQFQRGPSYQHMKLSAQYDAVFWPHGKAAIGGFAGYTLAGAGYGVHVLAAQNVYDSPPWEVTPFVDGYYRKAGHEFRIITGVWFDPETNPQEHDIEATAHRVGFMGGLMMRWRSYELKAIAGLEDNLSYRSVRDLNASDYSISKRTSIVGAAVRFFFSH